MTIEDQSGLKYLGNYLNEINKIIIDCKDNSNDQEIKELKTTNQTLMIQLNSLQNEIKNKTEELSKVSIKNATEDNKQKRIDELNKINENISQKMEELKESVVIKNEQYEKKVASYLKTIENNTNEIKSLLTENEQLNQEKNKQLFIINDLNTQLEGLKQQIQNIQNTDVTKLQECENRLNDLKIQFNELNSKNNSLNEQITFIQKEKLDLLK